MARINKIVELNDKKEKTAFLKALEKNNNIVKNLYDEAFINNEGICYNIKSHISKYQGRCIAYTSFNEVLDIQDNELFVLEPAKIANCLKAGKTGISHYEVKGGYLILFNSGIEYTIGRYIDNKEIDYSYLKEMDENKIKETEINHIMENFKEHEFVDLKVGEYGMMITHRLFPLFNKTTNFTVGMYSTCDETFYGVFTNTIEEKNKKEEVVFEAKIKYFYKFLHL